MPDELLDIVDDNDLVIDQQMRSTVHELGLQHRGVHVFLFTTDGEMLIQKRSADRVQSPSMLDCSVSEHVKAGESYFEAAIRGLREELGISDLAITPIVKFKMKYDLNDNEISAIYEGIVDPEKVVYDPGEIDEIVYISAEELHEKIMDQTEQILHLVCRNDELVLGKPD